jgi:hypothetical protein
MTQLLLHTSRAFILAFLVFLSLTLSFPSRTFANGFEVWLVDQSNSFDKTYGGAIYIYEGSDLSGKAASSATPAKVDLGNDAAGGVAHLCLSQTGAPPVRPHMLLFNSSHSHAILSFVVSGHVVIFEAASRTPVACLHTSVGTTGARQAHAAFPAPDDAYILVANQNGKLLERIDVHYETNAFVLNPAATINLATCTTPNGFPCESAEVRPNNAPICPMIDSSSHLGFVTLAGGGLFVVDPTTTPMQILAEYTNTVIHGNGCGGIEAKGSMYINSGAGTETGNPSEFDVYRFPLSGYHASNEPNTPAPVVVFSDDTQPPAPERDSHGSVVTKYERYLWVMDRGLNVAEVFDTASEAHINTIDLNGQQSGLAPDLADIAPSGKQIFVSLRGPNPLSGSPHVASGSIPGLGIIQVKAGGKDGVLSSILPISNIDASGVERGDPHGIQVRLK